MPTHVTAITTTVPPTVLHQAEVRDVFAAQPGLSRLGRRLVGTAFDSSGIETRHSVITEFDRLPTDDPAFFDTTTDTLLAPSTGTRNALYTERAGALFTTAARDAVAAAPGLDPADVTHVVTASCTGFYAPGPDFDIAQELGLDPGVHRYHLGFMGCNAAFPALRAAAAFCAADPDAVVLVVAGELCSLHIRTSNDPDVIVAASLFSDGAGAAVVTGRPVPEGARSLRLAAFESVIVPDSTADMAWTIGDHGFDIVLSSYVPQIIEKNVQEALEPVLSHRPDPGGRWRDVPHWAIHPGGRSIVDKVGSSLDLTDEQLRPARETLRRFGNMSSATILFVLADVLASPVREREETVCALGFGPGLTVESALMTRCAAA